MQIGPVPTCSLSCHSGAGQFCGPLGNKLIEAELKSLLPLYEEKHCARGLQFVDDGIERWWSWGPDAFRGM